MKYVSLSVELLALLIACVAFAMGFNESHNALLHLQADGAVAEANRLLEQAQNMFSVAAVCGIIFLVLFLYQRVKNA